MHHTGPFVIPEIRDFVPEKVKPWILFFFFIIYQFTGGVYLAAVSQMSGSLSLLREDVVMAGLASLVGLGLTFSIMLRLKFRFSTKFSLITTAVGLIVCNLVVLHTSSVPLLVLVCFIAGIFRMWATFACNSTIQLWVTPKRDMSVWFCYIQLSVQSFIYLSGISTIYLSFLTQWQYVHWMMIGALLIVILITFLCFRHYRSMPKLPLFGIDWLGAMLWGVTLLSVIFVLNYGHHYDWWHSIPIRTASFFACAALLLNIWRASFIRHPYIANKTWSYKPVWLTFLLFIVVEILISPSSLFERLLGGAILSYDSLNLISLNWAVFAGNVIGAVVAYIFFAKRKWRYKTMTLWGFGMILFYLLYMYFYIDYNLPKERLLFPIVVRSIGYIIIAITFITALTEVPFTHFWQSLSIQSFISASCGVLVGEAFLEELFSIISKKNEMLLSATLDRINPMLYNIPSTELYERLQRQVILVSMKEIYGWLSIVAVPCIALFFLRESTLRPFRIQPKFSTLRKSVKHDLRVEKIE